MQLVEGPTLKHLILDGELTPRRSVRLLSQVAKALDEAHAAGLIHRDVKPQNVLVGHGDHAYLADFGLIKAPADDALTQTGQFIGTIDYVAPEQVQGDTATGASDMLRALRGAVRVPDRTGALFPPQRGRHLVRSRDRAASPGDRAAPGAAGRPRRRDRDRHGERSRRPPARPPS